MIELNSDDLEILGAVLPSKKELLQLKRNKITESFWTRTVGNEDNTDGVWYWEAEAEDYRCSRISFFKFKAEEDGKLDICPLLVIETKVNCNPNTLVLIDRQEYISITPHTFLKVEPIGWSAWQTDYDDYVGNIASYNDSIVKKHVDKWFEENFN